MRPALLVLVVAAVALSACLGQGPGSSTAPPERATFLTIASFDGHPVPVTIYRPEGASAAAPVPVVLHSHGWGGARETRLEAFRAFTDAGLAVVSIDMRGHGEARATSQARVASPDFEIRDVQAVLGHLAGLDWVRQEAAGDPVAGAMGESYGGAFPLLTAALDSRLDAVVAEDTWNDLVHALAPNGVPKTAWVASLWLSAAIQGRIHPDIRAGFEQTLRDGAVPASLAAALAASSPSHQAGGVAVPALFVQGANDSLFDLGEALRNHAQATGPVALVAHLGGHSLDTPVRGNATAPPSRHPCGLPDALALAWFQRHLLGEDTATPTVCLALDGGGVLTLPALPEPNHATHPADPLRLQVGNMTARAATPVRPAGGDGALVGVPRLEGTVAPTAASGVVYWSLEAVDAEGHARAANGQAMPQRVVPSGSPQPFAFDLAPVALRLRAGETLRLAVAGHHALYAAAPAPSGVAEFGGLRVALPALLDVA
ncbi:MAG: type transport system ATP-binding protein [Thermoplasmata archaeon]|nr:type transport system ATP-binding protein [Thermoplasmata archaeon]